MTRTRRTTPHSENKSQVQLIGSPCFLGRQKLRLPLEYPLYLLTILAAEQDWVSRSTLCHLLYPDIDLEVARNRMRQLLQRIRQQAIAPQLEAERERLRWAQGSDLHLLKKAIAQQDHPQIYALYRADLLEGFQGHDSEFAIWLGTERENLLQHWNSSSLQIAHDLQAEHPERAIEVLQVLLKRDPLQDAALLQLFTLVRGQQQHQEACLLFEQHCRMQEEMGFEPSEHVLSAFAELQRSHLSLTLVGSPAPGNALVGRTREFEQLFQLLRDPGIQQVSIFGLGGTGKTHLALQFYHQSLVPGLWVQCDHLHADAPLVPYLATLLNLEPESEQAALQCLRKHLQAHPLLLVLDNAEHMTRQVCDLLESLQGLKHIKVLVTTRRRLRHSQEHVLELQGLSCLPGEGGKPSEAAQLFLSALQKHSPSLPPNHTWLPAIETLCRKLAGLPLAIILAAAWCRLLNPQEVQQQLDFSVDFLAGSLEGLPSRQDGLQAVFEHSWRLLDPETQQVFRKLAVLPGGFDTPTALQVSRGHHRHLWQLLDNALLKRSETDPYRFEVHPLIQEFIHGKLQEHPEDFHQAHERLLVWAKALMQEHRMSTSQNPVKAVQTLTREYRNLKTALDWAILHQLEDAMQLAIDLAEFCETTHRCHESLQDLKRVMETARGLPATELHAQVLLHCGLQFWIIDKLSEAESCLNQSLDLAIQLGLPRLQRRLLSNLGLVAYSQRNTALALSYMHQSVDVAEQMGELASCCGALCNMAAILMVSGDFQQATHLATKGLKYAETLGKPFHVACATGLLGILDLISRKTEAAERQFLRSLQVFSDLQVHRSVAVYTYYLAVLRFQQQHPDALKLLLSHIQQGTKVREGALVCSAIQHVCSLLHQQGQPAPLALWWEKAETLTRRINREHMLSSWLFDAPRPADLPASPGLDTLDVSLDDAVEHLAQEVLDHCRFAGALEAK